MSKARVLTIDLVPMDCWGTSLYNLLSRKDWSDIRKKALAKQGNKCAICQAEGTLHCHEVWERDDTSHTQTLRDVVALCELCHMVKHLGKTEVRAEAGELWVDLEDVIAHYMAVNGCDREAFESDRLEAAKVWVDRLFSAWEIDLGKYQQLLDTKCPGCGRILIPRGARLITCPGCGQEWQPTQIGCTAEGKPIYRHRTAAWYRKRREASITYQYWQHKASGEVFAVQVQDGHSLRYTGPLHYSEVYTANLENMAYEDLNDDEYTLHTIPAYEDAKRRVNATPELAAHRGTILCKGAQEEHYRWVATETVAEIVDDAECTEEALDDMAADEASRRDIGPDYLSKE